MSAIKVRFAPSPTGYLHIGNVRTALVNWLFARKNGGAFLLRSDDTDKERSSSDYEQAIEEDLKWLGLEWDEFARQSDRNDRYEIAKQKLIKDGRLYPCYESQEELEVKRKMQLSRGLPPIYDRAALKLSAAEQAELEAKGVKAHWRLKLVAGDIMWEDIVRGHVKYQAAHLSDPILFREDGVPTYTMSSVVDDAELGISHIIRGEDHVTNTAAQIQLFEAIGAKVPTFAHLALIKTKEGGMSKREGGYDIRSLRKEGIEAMTICSLLARLGTSEPVEACDNLAELAGKFDLAHFGRAPANYDRQELDRLNAKIVAHMDFKVVQPRLIALGLNKVDANFWNVIRQNITVVEDAAEWWRMCKEVITPTITDADFAASAAELLPAGQWDENTWQQWVGVVKEKTGRKGKDLFMPLRLALTGREHGPDLKDVLPMIGPEKTRQRLLGKAA